MLIPTPLTFQGGGSEDNTVNTDYYLFLQNQQDYCLNLLISILFTHNKIWDLFIRNHLQNHLATIVKQI